MMHNKKNALLAGVLFLSLLANMFMGGILLGNSYRAWHPEKSEELREKLSAGDRQIVQKEMKAQKGAFNLLRKDLGDARVKIEEALQANDPDALEEALRDEKNIKTNILKLIQESRVAAMEKMSPEGKAALQEIIDANSIRVGLWQNSTGQDIDLPPDLGGPDEPYVP